MEANFSSNNKTARLAAFLFIFVCIPLAMWGEIYTPSKIFVPQDPAMTAKNLLSNEFSFRASILSHFSIIVFAFMSLLFYRLFRPVDKHLSRLMLIPVLVQIPIVIVFEIFNLAALSILKSDARPTFDVVQQQEVAYLLLRISRIGGGISKFFLGLSFIPLGMLVIRSGFMPRVFGFLIIISGAGYISDSCFYILLQRTDYLVVQPFARGAFLGYLLALLWMLVKGVRDPKPIVN